MVCDEILVISIKCGDTKYKISSFLRISHKEVMNNDVKKINKIPIKLNTRSNFDQILRLVIQLLANISCPSSLKYHIPILYFLEIIIFQLNYLENLFEMLINDRKYLT